MNYSKYIKLFFWCLLIFGVGWVINLKWYKPYSINLFYERVLTNCQVLLDNCADPNERTLEFSPNIKRGLELLEECQKLDLNQLAFLIWSAICVFDERNKITQATQVEIQRILDENLKHLNPE